MGISLSRQGVRAIVALALLFSTVDASAQAGEDEVFLTLGLDYASQPDFRSDSRGVGASASAFWGAHRLVAVGGLASWAHHFPLADGARADAREVLGAFAGASFNIDIFEVVPFVSLMPGVMADGTSAAFALRAALGADWRPRRRWALGADIAWHATVDGGFALPGYAAVRVRFSYVLDTRRF